MKEYLYKSNITIKKALSYLTKTGNKTLVIVGKGNIFKGTLSDGDIRKSLLAGSSLDDSIENIYQKKCITFNENNFDKEKAIKIFSSKKIDLIPILGPGQKIIKIILLGDLIFKRKKRKNNLNIPSVIMAGGEGTRLKPFTKILPKPLIPIEEETILEKIISNFLITGVNDFYISINYKSKLIKAFFEELSPKYKVNFVEEKKPLGTAGSLYMLKNKIKTPFFLSNCDTIIKADYLDFYNFHKKNGFDLTLVASAKNYEIPYGTCNLKNGKLSSISEKPSHNYLINTGLYILNPKLLNLIPKNRFFHITQLIEEMIKNKMNVGVYTIDEDSWIDVGQWAEYKKAIEIFEF